MPMPYTLTKGPLFLVMEQTLNDPSARGTVLDQLRDPQVRLADIPWVVNGPGSTVTIPGVLRERLFEDWFGYRRDSQGGWSPQPNFQGRSTGYWVGYFGNTEAVLREGLVRTLEVALDISRDEPASAARRSWTVETAWKCPNPWFEVWVSWKHDGSGPDDGHVTMLVCTPPDTKNRLVTDPEHPPATAGTPGSVRAPARTAADEGMWLVAYKKHRPTLGFTVLAGSKATEMAEGESTLAGTSRGEWAFPVPSTFWIDSNSPDDVVVVSPPRHAGGV